MAGASAKVTFFSKAPRGRDAQRAAPAAGTISVVVPAYNAAPWLSLCVDSLLAQSRRPGEIIVVDDASTDDTAEIAARLPVRLLRLPRNTGAAYARSFGAARANGAIVAFLDSDCSAPPDWLERIAAELDADPSLGGVGGRYDHLGGRSATALLAMVEEEYAHQVLSRTPLSANPPAGNSAFRRDVWLKQRSGAEMYLFRGINSGEDEFACNEIRRTSPIKYVHSLSVVHHARAAGGYFRRHINRGRGLGLRLSKNMLADAQGSTEAYGGLRLVAASAAFALAFAALLLALATPWALVAAGALFVASLALSRDFRRFARSGTSRRVTRWDELKILALLPVRTACWTLGVTAYYAQRAASGWRKRWNVVISILHFWMPGRISKLFYFVTSACNARCAFCFNLENVENWSSRKASELTLAEVEQIARNFKRLPYLNISGGEPFIRPDLPDVIEAFHVHCKTQWVTIPTNASLTSRVVELTQEILARCPTLFLTIQVSIDGLGETHDKSRKISGGFDAMVRTLQTLAGLRRWYPNLRLQIATAFDDFNVGQMEEIIRFCRERLDYDQQMFYLIRDTGELITRSKNHLVPAFLSTLAANEAHETRNRKPTLWSRAVRALQNVTYGDFVRIREKGEFLRPCHATRKFVTLYDDGQISPCEVLEPVSLGNIRDFGYDYYRLIAQKKAADFYRSKIVDDKCNCDWMCAVPINMLYDPKVIGRTAKALFKPDTLA
jgi:MoaA/NifB/PqqE/SkfB family radical SAM enzyme